MAPSGSSDSWKWDKIEHYRLDEDIILDFLEEIFGHGRYEIKVRSTISSVRPGFEGSAVILDSARGTISSSWFQGSSRVYDPLPR